MKKVLKSINNNSFEMEETEKEYISVLAEGYIITKDGSFLCVGHNDHSDIFSTYLANYLEKPGYFKQTTDAAKEICELGNVTYFGVRLGDKVKDTSMTSGHGVLVLPTELTENQEEAVVNLLKTNKSIFGDRKKMSIQIATFSAFYDENIIDEDYLLQTLEEKIQNNHHHK